MRGLADAVGRPHGDPRSAMWVHALHLLEAIATAAACVVILEAGYRYATRNAP
jgi:hypothetical protein